MTSEWKLEKLGDVGECSIGLTYRPADVCDSNGTLVFRSSNVRNGRIVYNDDDVYVNLSVPDALRVREGDILICVRNGSRGLIGKCALIDKSAAGKAFGAFMAVYRSPHNKFVYQLFQTREYRNQIRRNLGATINQITNKTLKELEFPFPSLAAQERICEILSTWDNTIQTLDRLISAKECMYAAVSVALLKGHIRVTGDNSEWLSVRFSDVTRELVDRNNGRLGGDVVMGVNKIHGMVPMKEHLRAEDLSRYKIVPRNSFAYNPMRLNVGSLAMNANEREVLVSPDYVAFAVRPDRLDNRFFDHLRHSSIWNNFVANAGSGSVRVRIYYEHLSDLSFRLPSVYIQSRIADVIDTAEREIKILKEQATLLDQQKRGLIQKLLAGEWRVQISDREVPALVARATGEAVQ